MVPLPHLLHHLLQQRSIIHLLPQLLRQLLILLLQPLHNNIILRPNRPQPADLLLILPLILYVLLLLPLILPHRHQVVVDIPLQFLVSAGDLLDDLGFLGVQPFELLDLAQELLDYAHAFLVLGDPVPGVKGEFVVLSHQDLLVHFQDGDLLEDSLVGEVQEVELLLQVLDLAQERLVLEAELGYHPDVLRGSISEEWAAGGHRDQQILPLWGSGCIELPKLVLTPRSGSPRSPPIPIHISGCPILSLTLLSLPHLISLLQLPQLRILSMREKYPLSPILRLYLLNLPLHPEYRFRLQLIHPHLIDELLHHLFQGVVQVLLLEVLVVSPQFPLSHNKLYSPRSSIINKKIQYLINSINNMVDGRSLWILFGEDYVFVIVGHEAELLGVALEERLGEFEGVGDVLLGCAAVNKILVELLFYRTLPQNPSHSIVQDFIFNSRAFIGEFRQDRTVDSIDILSQLVQFLNLSTHYVQGRVPPWLGIVEVSVIFVLLDELDALGSQEEQQFLKGLWVEGVGYQLIVLPETLEDIGLYLLDPGVSEGDPRNILSILLQGKVGVQQQNSSGGFDIIRILGDGQRVLDFGILGYQWGFLDFGKFSWEYWFNWWVRFDWGKGGLLLIEQSCIAILHLVQLRPSDSL